MLRSGIVTGFERRPTGLGACGKLGERTIGKDGEIILGPPFTFDAANIDQFDF